MEEQKIEELAKLHPDIFQKSGDFECSVGDGWYDIINTLCGMLSHRVEDAKSRAKYAIENPNVKFIKSIANLEREVVDALEELPVIAQVKEKFGTLRFHVHGGTAEMNNYIDFAEAMTSHVCEECGSPGKSRSGSWVKVLCNEHHRILYPEDYPDVSSNIPHGPKLAEE